MTAWNALSLTPAVAVAVFFVAIFVEVCKDAVKEEARTRLERLPVALLHMAARRLPSAVRTEILNEEWQPELHFIVSETQGLPITRVVRGTCFSFGLLRTAKSIGRELEEVRGGENDSPSISRPRSSLEDSVKRRIYDSLRPARAGINTFFFGQVECYWPECGEPELKFSNVDGRAIANLEVAHICALNVGEPRYASEMNPQSWGEILANIILLCPAHHRLVDSDSHEYPVARLVGWKLKKECGLG